MSFLIGFVLGLSVLPVYLVYPYVMNLEHNKSKVKNIYNTIRESNKTKSTLNCMYQTVKTIINHKRYQKKFKVKHLNGNRYLIEYNMGDDEYKVIFKKVMMLSDLSCIKDSNNRDITHEIKPFLGPNLDFHGHDYTPLDFGHDQMSFILDDMTEIVFKSCEPIKLNIS